MKSNFMIAITAAISVWIAFTEKGYGATRYTIWPATAAPAVIDSGPDSAVELGVKFRCDSGGTITAIRYYKATANTGTHVGNLWTSSGTKLATVTFSGETASGWQQANLATPVEISANTVYVASYHTNTGHYSEDLKYFTGKNVDNAPLHALRDGASGADGVYAYGSASEFPNQGYRGSNYWVDVVFVPSTADTVPPTVTAFSLPSSSTSLTVAISSFTATDNVGVTGYLVTESATSPSSSAGGWSSTAPSSYSFASSGTKTLYAWAMDGAGNVSASRSASVKVSSQSSGSGPEPAGWYAGDMHVHRSCGGTPETVASLYQKMGARNLSVISLLADMGNGEVQNASTDLPRVNGEDDPASTAGRTVHWDAEWHWDPIYYQYPHQALGGHLVALGLNNAYQIWEEYTYPIFNWAHQQNAIAGFAHMQYLDGGIPQSLTCCTPLEYPVEVALGEADFISEDVDDVNYNGPTLYPENAIQAYYKLLNCGFRPGLAAGTDYPCNETGAGLGALLTYVNVGDSMTYRNWVSGIAQGKTVISRNGHNEFLDLKVNGVGPGSEINLSGADSVQVSVAWTANQNLSGTMELVKNGVVVATKQASATGTSSPVLSATVAFEKSGWLAARRMGSDGHTLHTAAVFVTINGAPVRASADDANFFVQWMDNLLQKTSPGGAWSSYFANSRSAAQARYHAARAVFQQIASEAAGSSGGGGNSTIFTAQTPTLYENDGAYELGTKFWSDIDGKIAQVRLYTNASEGGDHTVRIWRVRDATVVAGPYTWSVPSGTVGWRTYTLSFPISISANTDYVVSVSNSSDRYYAEQPQGFAVPIVNGHLHTYVGSGVYTESPGAMPGSSWNNTNYFRDVVFTP